MVIKVGCCGFPRRKAEYAERFPVVEVQQTFYQPPRLSTAQRWRAEVPPAFEFTLKAWQLITHEPRSPTYRRLKEPIPEDRKNRYGAFRPTEEVHAAWERTREMAEALRARIVLFQCPASFTPTEEHIANVRAFFTEVERGGLIFAWEPRGAWPDETVAALCRQLDLIHAVDPFQRLPVTPHLAYFRLHGRTGYRYRYTDEDLECLLGWCRRFDEVYCLFNNVSMWEDGLRMREACQRHRDRAGVRRCANVGRMAAGVHGPHRTVLGRASIRRGNSGSPHPGAAQRDGELQVVVSRLSRWELSGSSV